MQVFLRSPVSCVLLLVAAVTSVQSPAGAQESSGGDDDKNVVLICAGTYGVLFDKLSGLKKAKAFDARTFVIKYYMTQYDVEESKAIADAKVAQMAVADMSADTVDEMLPICNEVFEQKVEK
jgi:hypothetical protein